MKASAIVFAVVAVISCAVFAAAQEPLAMQPTVEHKELEAWVGSWAGILTSMTASIMMSP